MPSSLPDGETAPEDGSLPPEALQGVGTRPFGLYVHVPFCAVRCGYCDFNTYTAEELGPATIPGASRATYADAAVAEVRRIRGAELLEERTINCGVVNARVQNGHEVEGLDHVGAILARKREISLEV